MLSGDAQQFVCLVLCATIIIDKETPNGVIRELCTASRFYALATELEGVTLALLGLVTLSYPVWCLAGSFHQSEIGSIIGPVG